MSEKMPQTDFSEQIKKIQDLAAAFEEAVQKAWAAMEKIRLALIPAEADPED